MNFKQIHPDFGHHNTEGGRTEQLLLFFLFDLTSNIIQLSPEGEVNSGGYIPRREASRYISTALHRP